MTAQVAADLRAAAEVLRRDGWTQGVYHSFTGCHCAEGAIAAAIGQHRYLPDDAPESRTAVYLANGWWTCGGPDEWRRRSDVEDALRSFIGGGTESVFDWNDAPDRTADEVIAALEAAAAAAEAAA